METYLLVVLTIILAPIIIEDFRHRKISLLWILGVTTIAIFQQLRSNLPLSSIATNTIINFCIIIFNYGMLTLYFSIKNKKIVDIKTDYLGIGDIAFLLSVALLFSPVNFLCFLLCSLIFTLLFTLFTRLFSLTKFSTIPLAGLQAVFLGFILVTMFISNKNWKTNNDEFTLTMILKYAGIS